MSASPAGSTEGAEQSKKITFRFCSECSNLLYPKEDKVHHELLFACRTCQYTTSAISPMVTRKEVSSSAGDTAGLTQDIGQDPTVGDPDSISEDYENEIHFCTMCGQEIFCEVCGLATDAGVCLEVEDEEMDDAPLDNVRPSPGSAHYDPQCAQPNNIPRASNTVPISYARPTPWSPPSPPAEQQEGASSSNTFATNTT